MGAASSRLRGLPPLPAAVLVATTAALPVFLTGALAVQVGRHLHFGSSRLGLAVATYFAAAAVCSIPFGRLAEVAGGRRVMRAACLGSTVAMVLIATVVHSWTGLVLCLVLAGVSSSAVQPAVNLFLHRAVPAERQGWAFGIKQAAVPLATLLGGLAVPLVALTVGWRFAYVGGAGVAVLAAAASGSRGEPPPRRSAGEPRAHVDLVPLVVLAAAFGLGIGAATALGSFVVESAVAAGFAKGVAGIIAAVCAAASVGARLLTGRRADRRGGRHLPVVAVMLASGSLGYALLATGVPGLFVLGALLAFGAGWGWNGLFNFAVVRTHPQAPGRATGITQAGGRLGGVIGPLVFGLLVDHRSYVAAWAFAAAAAVAGSAIMIGGRRLLRVRPPLNPPEPAARPAQ